MEKGKSLSPSSGREHVKGMCTLLWLEYDLCALGASNMAPTVVMLSWWELVRLSGAPTSEEVTAVFVAFAWVSTYSSHQRVSKKGNFFRY